MWIGLFPEFSEVGGIQQVSRHAGAALSRIARDRSLPCRLLGLNDPSGPGTFLVGRDEYGFQGFGRNKAALVSYLLRAATRIETLVIGHVNLAPLGLLLRLVRPRLRYWVAAHGVEVWEPLPIHRRLALRWARGVLSVSAYTANQIVKTQKLNPRGVLVLPPALDPNFVLAACDGNTPPLPAGHQVLLTVGRLISAEPGKGVDSVIRVLPDVLKEVPNLLYVVVGEGDLKRRLEELSQESPARDHILFVGKLKLEQLRHYYSRCDIYIMPSRQEGFGLVFLEAMALGKPVIAGDCGGAPEIVQDGLTGFLVNPDDRDELAERLIRLLQDEGLRKRMGDAGRQHVEESYTFPRFQERLAHILDTAP
jgi:phosphatidyl-myo-inositol dimannoside synthase